MKRIIGLLIITALVTGCKKSSSGPGSGNNNGNGSNGNGSSDNNGPGIASLLTPVKDEICTTGTVVSDTISTIAFTWNTVQKATSYEVSIKNLLTQAVVTKDVSGAQVTVDLARNTPYSWFVTSKKSGSSGTSKSETWKFYNGGNGIVTYAPYPAEILAPTLGQIVTSTNGKVSLKWTGSVVSGKIVSYNVYFGPTNNPDVFRTQITDSFVNDVAVSANTTYYWHVITVDSNGNFSDSGLYNFYVQQ